MANNVARWAYLSPQLRDFNSLRPYLPFKCMLKKRQCFFHTQTRKKKNRCASRLEKTNINQ